MTPDITQLQKHVSFLSKIQPVRNHQNIGSLNKVVEYLQSVFEAAGGRVELQLFEVNGETYKNVIASFGPLKGERIIVGAHYDSYADSPGADGNASGVAGILELARMLGEEQGKLKQRIDFVAYCLKEAPYYETEHMGSALHAKSLKEEGVEVKAMICCEMIGYFSDAPDSQYFPDTVLETIYPTTGNFALVVGLEGQYDFLKEVYRVIDANSSNVNIEFIFFPSAESFGGMSDHRNYWRYEYPAVMVTDTAFFRNPHYHQPTDTVETLDFDKMAKLVNGVFGYLLQ